MKRIILLMFVGHLLVQFTQAEGPASDRTKVEFFEKLYKTKLVDVKPLEEYDDPDKFYSAIAKQVGIPKMAFDAVKKEFGWKQDKKFFLQAMVKGSGVGDEWGVMVVRAPIAITKAKTPEERKELLKEMGMKFVVIKYDGTISFPKEKKKDPAKKR